MTAELLFVWGSRLQTQNAETTFIESARQKQNASKLQSSQPARNLSSQLLAWSHCAHWLVTAGLLAMPEQTGLCGLQKAA